jgi:hypothetical protein
MRGGGAWQGRVKWGLVRCKMDESERREERSGEIKELLFSNGELSI